jgi:hypothetical protein
MPGPADERIKRYLDKRAKDASDKSAAEADANRVEEERKATAARYLKKWTADTRVIAAVLADLGKKLAAARADLSFQDMGPNEAAIAVGRIAGELAGEPVDFVLSVGRDGNVEGSKRRPLAHSKMRLTSPTKFPILTASAAEYEAVILDLLDVD